jgi:hypothetical protein
MFGSLQGQESDELIDNSWIQANIRQQRIDFDYERVVGESIISLWDRYEKECYEQADTFWVPIFGYFESDSSSGWSSKCYPIETGYTAETILPTKNRQEEGLVILPYKPEFDIRFIEWLKKQ